MSIPRIPGFTDASKSLADEWARPGGDFIEELWPQGLLHAIDRYPSDWIVVEQYDGSTGGGSTGVSSFLTTKTGWEKACQSHGWSARYLGDYVVEGDPGCDNDGLFGDDDGVSVEYLVSVRNGRTIYPIEVQFAYPFLWFWNADRTGNNWSYLDLAGNEHPLIRTTVNGAAYQVEVRALEFRRYLERRQRVAVIQYDHIIFADSPPFSSESFVHASEWAAFVWTPSHQQIGSNKDSFSRLLGKRLVDAVSSGPNPAMLDWDNPEGEKYPEFIYGLDAKTGKSEVFTSDPDALANYFGKNPESPHYLTPIYFNPKVLNRYRDEPSKYQMTSTRLSCLVIWGISLGESTSGLVEVYLGDLGRDLPWQEWPHWKAHNVLPGGKMAEDRYRRDFLAQWAGEPTTLDEMRSSLQALRETSVQVLGWPLIRELDGSNLVELMSFRLPTTTEERELVIPVLTLAKAFVDAINEKELRSFVGVTDTSQRSLALLEKFVSDLGGDVSIVQPFRTLYRLRSSGGLAHWGGSDVSKTLDKLGLLGMPPADVIAFLAAGLRKSCLEIGRLLKGR
ncbi:hypothetical protein [Clavibacter michiganensis]|uniref:hypothetical protein n=1 Tax=Clavibacter michiganensis TaxID=28447 RepID=UPI0026DB2A5E|nr:hypothetical protein [Clavibacter michiganensis]MDO4067187.1 hypothetical protein [Clavibacter michiganensis]MDO4073013.1 hypothetical protein [Clavibacter michiganensis]MDO4091596.1 hypothetical protein [Clavibacter michiganensis]